MNNIPACNLSWTIKLHWEDGCDPSKPHLPGITAQRADLRAIFKGGGYLLQAPGHQFHWQSTAFMHTKFSLFIQRAGTNSCSSCFRTPFFLQTTNSIEMTSYYSLLMTAFLLFVFYMWYQINTVHIMIAWHKSILETCQIILKRRTEKVLGRVFKTILYAWNLVYFSR